MLPDSEYFDHLSTPSTHPRPVVLSRAAISSGHHFLRSIRSVGLEPNADRFGSHPFRWAHIPAGMTPAHTTQFGSNHIRFASTSTRTAPVDDQLPPRRSHNVDSSYLQYFGNSFIFFLLSHRHPVQIAISRCFLSASLRILCSVHSDFR